MPRRPLPPGLPRGVYETKGEHRRLESLVRPYPFVSQCDIVYLLFCGPGIPVMGHLFM